MRHYWSFIEYIHTTYKTEPQTAHTKNELPSTNTTPKWQQQKTAVSIFSIISNKNIRIGKKCPSRLCVVSNRLYCRRHHHYQQQQYQHQHHNRINNTIQYTKKKHTLAINKNKTVKEEMAVSIPQDKLCQFIDSKTQEKKKTRNKRKFVSTLRMPWKRKEEKKNISLLNEIQKKRKTHTGIEKNWYK